MGHGQLIGHAGRPRADVQQENRRGIRATREETDDRNTGRGNGQDHPHNGHDHELANAPAIDPEALDLPAGLAATDVVRRGSHWGIGSGIQGRDASQSGVVR